jgi:hypothetical protein
MKKWYLVIAAALALLTVGCGAKPSASAPIPSPTATNISDGSALPLTITTPPNETTVGTSRIEVSGKTRPDAVVSIDGEIVPVDSQGSFSGEVNLDVGPSVIEIIASDFFGNQASAILAVVYAAALPLTVTQPKNESIIGSEPVTVNGRTNADAVVSVNGKITPVDAQGGFSAVVPLDLGPNVIEILASDFAGNKASTLVTVIYKP